MASESTQKPKPIVVSGIRATGKLHLGNYFGALRNFVTMQEQFNTTFFIADLHSLTTHPIGTQLHDSIRQILAEYLAVGLDPQRSTIYVQSDLPETIELYLLLNMNAYLGELSRCTSFKEKCRKNPDNVNAGLLTYPTLMAADILIHRARIVPVGQDQEPHLEMARNFAARFNRMYKVDLFPEPKAYIPPEGATARIPGLDGGGKMGKSEGNAIYLSDSPEEVRRKVMKAVTDSGPTAPNQEMSEPVANLFTLMRYVSPADTYETFLARYNDCSIRYGDMKKQLAEDISSVLAPIRERIEYFLHAEGELARVAAEGAEKARKSAAPTLAMAKAAVGIRKL